MLWVMIDCVLFRKSLEKKVNGVVYTDWEGKRS